jgi:hypothetical protein
MTTFYEKRGKRYYPVLENEPWNRSGDTWHEGCHLVVCKPGTKITRYKVEPAQAAFLAAQTIHAEVLANLLQKASKAKINPAPLTQEQKDAWDTLQKTFNGGPYQLSYESSIGIAREFLSYLKEAIENGVE